PLLMDTHAAQALQGRLDGSGWRQLTALARMRAVVVLPVPRGPQNRYAWAMRSSAIAFFSVLTMWSCPNSSSESKLCGRYFRYSDFGAAASRAAGVSPSAPVPD